MGYSGNKNQIRTKNPDKNGLWYKARHHLKTDRMNVSSLTGEALPALAQEQSERTGREYQPRNEKDIPLETFARLLELAEDAWWISRERYCRLEYDSIREANIDINLLLTSDQEN